MACLGQISTQLLQRVHLPESMTKSVEIASTGQLRRQSLQAVGLLLIYGAAMITRTALEPRLVGRQLGLDPLVTLFALYAGYKIWGIGGMIFSPLLAVTAKQLLPEQRKK